MKTAALTIALAWLASPAMADDLFSEIAVEAVFATRAGAATTSAAPATRVTGAAQLARIARDAGFQPERLDAKAVRVLVQHGGRTLPVTLRADVDRGEVEVAMQATGQVDPAKLSGQQVLSLLVDRQDAGGAYYAYDPDNKRLELRRRLAAHTLSASLLTRLLEEMAESALSRSATASPAPAAQTKSPPAPARQATAAPNLAGSWFATISRREAFALRLSPGQFALVHVRDGRTTKSTGALTQTGADIRLAGSSGVTINGRVARVTPRGFELTLKSGRKLSFRKSRG